MTTYVLGAGASRHAGYPLAGELGDTLHDWICRNKPPNHDYRIHMDQLRELYGGLGNIEQVLTDLDECPPGSQAATLPGPIRANLFRDLRLSIREFFDDLRRGPAPLYKRLAGERIRPGDLVITFNYDVSCERELRQVGLWEISDGYGFPLGMDSIPPSRVKVLKLHGSTSWWGLMFGGSKGFGQASDMLGSRPVIFFLRPDFEFLGYSRELCDPACAGISEAAGAPAIIMPTLHKRFYEETSFGREWETFWQHLWAQAGRALQSSQMIVIIGYSMASADEKARELLLQKSNRDACITVCCGHRSTTIRNEFDVHGLQYIETFGQGRFEEYLNR